MYYRIFNGNATLSQMTFLRIVVTSFRLISWWIHTYRSLYKRFYYLVAFIVTMHSHFSKRNMSNSKLFKLLGAFVKYSIKTIKNIVKAERFSSFIRNFYCMYVCMQSVECLAIVRREAAGRWQRALGVTTRSPPHPHMLTFTTILPGKVKLLFIIQHSL